MLAKAFIYLSAAPLTAVFATYLGRNNALSSAVEFVADHGIHYVPPRGQYPVHDGPDHHHPEKVNGTIYEFISKSPKYAISALS
jgi:hypothetical protein